MTVIPSNANTFYGTFHIEVIYTEKANNSNYSIYFDPCFHNSAIILQHMDTHSYFGYYTSSFIGLSLWTLFIFYRSILFFLSPISTTKTKQQQQQQKKNNNKKKKKKKKKKNKKTKQAAYELIRYQFKKFHTFTYCFFWLLFFLHTYY